MAGALHFTVVKDDHVGVARPKSVAQSPRNGSAKTTTTTVASLSRDTDRKGTGCATQLDTDTDVMDDGVVHPGVAAAGWQGEAGGGALRETKGSFHHAEVPTGAGRAGGPASEALLPGRTQSN